MQQTVYKCDHCKKEIGRKSHITLMFSRGTGTGIAVPNNDPTHSRWETKPFSENFVHFHSGKCAGAYFDALIVKHSKKSK